MKRGRPIKTNPPKPSKPVKRARKDNDIPSPSLKASGLKIRNTDTSAAEMARRFFNHFREQDDRAQYSDDVACSLRINIPSTTIGFDWVNDGVERDHFVVVPWSLTGDTQP
jgi:hypothetical protein